MTTSETPRMAMLTDRAAEVAAFVRALDQLGHGALLLEGERITDASPAFARLVGYDRAALLELPSVFDLVVPEQRAGLRDALGRYARGERAPDQYSVAVQTPSGDSVSLSVAIKSIEPGAMPPRLIVLAQDIGSQRGVQQQFGFQSRMLESIAETSADGILVVDDAGRMTYLNRRFVELWQIPADVVASRSDEAAVAAVRSRLVDPEAFTARVAYLYANPTEHSRDEIRLLDGRVIDRYSAPVIVDGQPRGRVWFFRDVTVERGAEESRELLARLGELLGASLEVETTLDQIAHAVVPLFADWAALDILDHTGAFRRVGVAHVDPLGEETLRQLDQRWPLVPEAGHLRGRVVATRRPVTIYDLTPDDLASIARDADHRRLLEKLGMASALWVPLIARERVLGVASVGRAAGRLRFQASDLELLTEIARRSALAIDNARLYRDVQRGEARQAALAQLGARALAGDPLPLLFDHAATLLARTMDADFSEILQMVPDGSRLLLVAGEGWRQGRVGKATVAIGKGSQGGYTLATVGPVVVEDLAAETRFRPSKLLLEHGVQSGLTVVVGGDPPWGALGAFSHRPRHFAEDDIHFVQAMANTLAAAIERKEAEAELGRLAGREVARAAELKAVIESIGDAVVVCDASGRVALANPAAQQLFGTRLGSGMRAILRSFAWPTSGKAPAVAALQSGAELRLTKAADGSGPRWMELSVYPVLVGDADAPGDGGTILVMRDITAARESRQVRDAFLGILSHELRSPVTTIYGGAEVLSRESPPPDEIRREIYADLRAEADRLYRLVENLLVLSRVERDGLRLEPEPVLLQRVLPRIVRSERGRSLGVEFELDIPPGLPPIAAEETYLEQVLQNLLGNAAKYGGSHVNVVLSEEADDDGRIHVAVRVQDNGPGFAAHDAEHMFEVFYRSPAASQRASGAGIGLFVSQQLVKAMGGRIWALNRPEGGAEFGFAVPVFED